MNESEKLVIIKCLEWVSSISNHWWHDYSLGPSIKFSCCDNYWRVEITDGGNAYRTSEDNKFLSVTDAVLQALDFFIKEDQKWDWTDREFRQSIKELRNQIITMKGQQQPEPELAEDRPKT